MNTERVFTTGEAAKICKVSQQTIIRCFDNGDLVGFRVPGSRFRRIPERQVYKFMKKNKIPTDGLIGIKTRALLFVQESLGVAEVNEIELEFADCGWTLGTAVQSQYLQVIVVDVALEGIGSPLKLVQSIRGSSQNSDAVIALRFPDSMSRETLEALGDTKLILRSTDETLAGIFDAAKALLD